MTKLFKRKKTSIIFLLILWCTLPASSQHLTVATFNLRGDGQNDIGNLWSDRKFMVTDVINRYSFDIIGVQEITARMTSYLVQTLPRFDSIGNYKIGTGILYNKERLSLKGQGQFWLSATPENESKGWDGKFKRICVWGKFRDLKTGLEFYAFNSHFDHVGVQARSGSTSLVLEKLKQIAGDTPGIVMGDFNTLQSDPNYIKLNNSGVLKDCFNLAAVNHEKERGTGNGFNINRRRRDRVDHIFLTNTLRASEYDVIVDLYNNHTSSDHYAVMAKIFPKKDESGDLYRQFPEDFEGINPPKTSYGAGKVEAKTGTWLLNNAIVGGSAANDKPTSGTSAVRMINGNTESAYLQMNFDVTEGASKVTLNHGIYASDSASRWQLEYSTNQGSTWAPLSPVVVTHQGFKQQAIFILDIKGKVRFRVNKLGLGPDNNGRLSIDDFTIYKRKHTAQERKNATLLAWQFGKPLAKGSEEYALSGYSSKSVNSSKLTRGEGFGVRSSNGSPIRLTNGFAAAAKVATSTSATDTTAAFANNLYLQFFVKPAPSQKVSLSTLDARLMATGKNKKLGYWRYSTDGINFKALAKPFEFSSAVPSSQNTINLSENPELQNLSAEQTIYFRFYVNGLSPADEIVGIGSSDRFVKNTIWTNPEIPQDYVLQVTGFSEKIKK